MTMTETIIDQTEELDSSEDEVVEWSVDVPQHGDFVPCDSCQSRSYAHALVGDTLLSYCGHHFTKYEEGLTKAGLILADYRDKISEKPSQSSN